MSSYPVQSVKVSHDVVALLADRGATGVTEVARALDLPKSTAHDHLRTLERVGYVVSQDGRYRLGGKLYHLGETARRDHELFVHGQAEALALDDRIEGKHVQLVTEENGRCVILLASAYRETATETAQSYPANVHLHTNAPGKAILAHEEPATVGRLLETHGLPERTPATITDREALLAELETVREQGYAVDYGELIAGMQGVAVPIVTDEAVHGAVSVYSPAGEFDAAPGTGRLHEALRETARAIEANLIFGGTDR